MVDFIIFTAISPEYNAVREHLYDVREIVHPSGTVYEHGIFHTACGAVSVGIVEVGVGNILSSMEAERAINWFKPTAVFFVGVAGGIKDVSLGDVVVASKVYGYESGKSTNKFLSRPNLGEPSYTFLQRSKAEARKEDWIKKIKSSVLPITPRVHIGALAAGEKVVASTASQVFRFIRQYYNDALAVEMEGRGFLSTVSANESIKAAVIRGISDLIDNKALSDSTGWQEIASKCASAFAFQLIEKVFCADFDKEGLDNNTINNTVNSGRSDSSQQSESLSREDAAEDESSYNSFVSECSPILLQALRSRLSTSTCFSLRSARNAVTDLSSSLISLTQERGGNLSTEMLPQESLLFSIDQLAWLGTEPVCAIEELKKFCDYRKKPIVLSFPANDVASATIAHCLKDNYKVPVDLMHAFPAAVALRDYLGKNPNIADFVIISNVALLWGSGILSKNFRCLLPLYRTEHKLYTRSTKRPILDTKRRMSGFDILFAPRTTCEECASFAIERMWRCRETEIDYVDIINGIDSLDYGQAVAVWSPVDLVYEKANDLTVLKKYNQSSIVSVFSNIANPSHVELAFANCWVSAWNRYIKTSSLDTSYLLRDTQFLNYFHLGVPIQLFIK